VNGALVGPESARVGDRVDFELNAADADGLALKYRWDLGDGTILTDQSVSGHVFKRPGFYRVGVTVSNGFLSSLNSLDFYVVGNSTEMGTEGNAAGWGWVDPMSKVKFSDDRETKIAGKSSLFAEVSPYGGFRLNLLYPSSKRAAWSLADKTRLIFWFKAINENLPAWQDANPIITLHESDDKFVRLTPKTDLLSSPPYLEAREGWNYFEVPLAGNAEWKREGGEITTVNFLTIGFDSWGQPPLKIWLDGLALE
jgi:PKD repeat protein